MRRSSRRRWVAVAAAGLAAALAPRPLGAAAPAGADPAGPDAAVFQGPPAACEPRLRDGVPAPGGPLRILTVEERVGAARRGELVRVPLFFHEGECADPDAVALYEAGDARRQRPIPCQADDVRRDPAGRVSRMHLYFAVDLDPWQRRQYHLAAGRNPGAALAPMPVRADADGVTLAGEDLRVTFLASGPRAGAVAAVETPLGRVAVAEGGLGPRVTLVRQAADAKVVRTTSVSYEDPSTLEVRGLRWGAGPLLAKLVVRVGPKGLPDAAEFTYRVPRRGSEFVQTERLMPEDPADAQVVGARENVLLAGGLVLGDAAADQQVVRVPAGLRRLTRAVHGHTLAALVNARAGLSLMPVPYVQTGMTDVEAGADGRVALVGTGLFQRTPAGSSASLRAFWGEVRFLFTKAVTEEDLWQVARAGFQPLTAIVDEPGVTAADFHAAATDLGREFLKIPYWGRGWAQNAALAWLARDTEGVARALEKGPKPGEDTAAFWLPAPPRDDAAQAKKPAGTPRLDPYMITYGLSGFVPLAAWVRPADRLDAIALTVARAQRQVNGRTDEFGLPYVQCFASALNMQVGSALCGLYAGRKAGDLDLAQFYRDAVRTPAVLGVYGHGQRPYTGCAKGPQPSDLLYEALSDHWLRTIELVCQEDLGLHPSVFGRYFDCVDVTADLAHRTLGEAGDRAPSWHRANFFRGQCHDHRWESWDAAPYVGLLAHAPDAGRVGLTEACYFVRHRVGRRVNWSELLPLLLADLNLSHGLGAYRPERGPPLPAGVQVRRGDAGNGVAWRAVAGQVLGYRVYRAERMGGPWTLLNSPYASPPAPLAAGTTYTDAGGGPGHVYFVTAVDAARRESRWFDDEPLPRPAAPAAAAGP